MRYKIKVDTFTNELSKMFPDAKCELNYETHFQLLCAVMWSAQTTDVQVNKATDSLFKKIREPEDLAELGLDELRKYIGTLGFFKTKAKHAIETAEILIKDYNSTVPNNIEELVTLPGVGIKTAKVVMAELFGAPYLAVDTHVHRVLNRLNFVNTKEPSQTDRKIDKIFSDEDKRRLHHELIFFGRYFCLAKKPRCEENCPFKENCKHYNKEVKNKRG